MVPLYLQSVDYKIDSSQVDIEKEKKPFQDIKVGPGLNNGTSSEGEGGFHNNKSGDFAKSSS